MRTISWSSVLAFTFVLGTACGHAAPASSPSRVAATETLRVARAGRVRSPLPVARLAAAPAPVPGLRTERSAGFTAGAIGGIGFAFRRFTSDGWGWQIGGLAGVDRSDRLVILGGQRMRTLRVRERSRFYALAGAMGILDTERFDELQPAIGAPAGTPPLYVRRRRNEASFNAGAGLGISYETESGVGFVLELPLVFQFEHGLESVSPIPQVGILYSF